MKMLLKLFSYFYLQIYTFIKRINNKYTPSWIILFIDTYLTIQSFFLAYIVINGFKFNYNFLKALFIVKLVSLFSFLLIGSYKGLIRHTGSKDAYNVFIALILVAIILSSLNFIDLYVLSKTYFQIPFSVIIIHFLLSTVILILSRFAFKWLFNSIISKFKSTSNILIYGAGDSGLLTYYAINEDKQNQLKVIGFIDDHKGKIGKKINQVKIYAPSQITKNFIIKNNIKEVIVSIQNINSEKLTSLVEKSLSKSLKVKIVPAVSNWINGSLKVRQIKDIKIEDLLGRKLINIENSLLKKEFSEKIILITGAAGSIGSEIARQIAVYNYHTLILLDQAESPLYDLQQDIKFKNGKTEVFIIADIRNKKRMKAIFDTYKPEIIFHAAAYKHVPLMEEYTYEAVNVNVIGTKIIMDLALEHNTEKFVMISTDKAVNPTNVMGASKRIAELYSMCLKNKGKTKFITTRFGNVLGSNGSVIPLFKRQIETGGPLRVTHQDITRYFMTIQEASQLVLEAGAMGKGGEIYVFDMGKSERIFDLAVKMIQLSGLKYPDDIDIEITGLRPGEKIYEELLANNENTVPTYHKKIMIANVSDIDVNLIQKKIDELCLINKNYNNILIVKKIKEIVPEYISNNSQFENLDVKVT
jgi:FlaA1/EpsC-like NDP-sugar epimerase